MSTKRILKIVVEILGGLGGLVTVLDFLEEHGLLPTSIIQILQFFNLLTEPRLSVAQVAFFGLIMWMIYHLGIRRTRKTTASPIVIAIQQPRLQTLYEIIADRERDEKIGQALVYLGKQYGEGFKDRDVKILEALEKGKNTIEKIAIFLDENEQNIAKRVEFLKKKGVLSSS